MSDVKRIERAIKGAEKKGDQWHYVRLDEIQTLVKMNRA